MLKNVEQLTCNLHHHHHQISSRVHRFQRLCLAVTLLIKRKEILSISMMLRMMSTLGNIRNLTILTIRMVLVDLVAVALVAAVVLVAVILLAVVILLLHLLPLVVPHPVVLQAVLVVATTLVTAMPNPDVRLRLMPLI